MASFTEVGADGGAFSEPFNIKDVMSSWGFQIGTVDQDAFLPLKTATETEEGYIQRKTGLTDEVLEELALVTGPDSLDVDAVREDPNWSQHLPEENNLNTIQYLKANSSKKQKERFTWGKSTRYPEPRLFNYYRDLPLPMDDKDRVEAPEVVLTVTVLRSFKFRQKKHSDSYFQKVRADLSYCVLSTQYLTELRDRFQCQIDYIVPGDFSEDPGAEKETRNRDIYPSGCFFIENTFYNDFRTPGSIDYSEPIVEWAKKKQLSDFKQADMAETRFIDLDIRLGQPYVYLHQGNCEHFFIFTDVRLLSPDDCFDRTCYPVVHNVLRSHRVRCRACDTFTATWMTSGSKRDPEDPCFYCDKCLQMFHYDHDGKKIDDFVLMHYVDKILEER